MMIPVLPLRDVVVYPHMVIPLFVGREKSIEALERAMSSDKRVLLVAQKDAAQDDPGPQDMYEVGTISSILQLLKLPDGTVKVLVEGGERARIERFGEVASLFEAEAAVLEGEALDEREADVMTRSLLTQFEQYVKLNKKVPPEILASLSSIDDPGRLADTIAAHLAVKIDQKQVILEIMGVGEPFGAVASFEERPFPATAVALADTVCLRLPRQRFFEMLREYPTLVRGLLIGLTHRLIELTTRITELTGGKVEPRLARLFLKLAEEQGVAAGGRIKIPMALSRQELADLTGTTIETCIRIMSRWSKDGIVATEEDGFTILDRAALELLAIS